jgi:hypothetical protein
MSAKNLLPNIKGSVASLSPNLISSHSITTLFAAEMLTELFDAKTDSILLSAENSIFLGTNNSVNISAANKVVIECDDIKFGDKDATEPFILGNKFLADMQKLYTQLVALGTALQTPIGAGPPFVPNAAIPVPAVNVTQAAQTMLNKIEKYKSKVTKSR